jgi:hypothetical protein
MTVEDAIRRVAELRAQLPSVEEEGGSGYRSGRVFITYMLGRGLEHCPHCGGLVNMGVIVVRHDDGRGVGFEPRLGHYIEVGHPITSDDIDGETLIAILTDA